MREYHILHSMLRNSTSLFRKSIYTIEGCLDLVLSVWLASKTKLLGSGLSAVGFPGSSEFYWIHVDYTRGHDAAHGTLSTMPNICPKSVDESRPIIGRTKIEVDVDSTMLDMEVTFCCQGDICCAVAGTVTVPWLPDAVWPGESTLI